MKYIAIDNGLKINTLEYNTFGIDGYESGEQIVENQSVSISIKLGMNKKNKVKRVLLLDVFIEGKNEEILLRKLHLDLFYEFEYKDKYSESDLENLDLYMTKYFLGKTNAIVENVSSIDQSSCFNLNDAIEDINKKVPEELSVEIRSIES
ncbi:hypothetical protein SK629_2069 [Streptococcus mitis]|uniref:Uncharacterized protein n=1 Tax=Streptococcus mitis TaxID=28037 RepID=A0A081PT00_STRMT|nr:hypothetical protein [Streptococcus mitis]KEQ33823.1 hypothetical protein SK629_2069 [Streptococcus mitis]